MEISKISLDIYRIYMQCHPWSGVMPTISTGVLQVSTGNNYPGTNVWKQFPRNNSPGTCWSEVVTAQFSPGADLFLWKIQLKRHCSFRWRKWRCPKRILMRGVWIVKYQWLFQGTPFSRYNLGFLPIPYSCLEPILPQLNDPVIRCSWSCLQNYKLSEIL